MPGVALRSVAMGTNEQTCSPRQRCDVLTCADSDSNNCHDAARGDRDLIVTFTGFGLMG